ncbi:hypothetical protein [Streptomyces zagrosensis]|uniref:hypothetical protein n=1 Tax=Streptomyces zagrosensis TaxID=1042984 RepID=UPI00162160B2|nr:hypothetical protein [Streptomyces zagrosensis]
MFASGNPFSLVERAAKKRRVSLLTVLLQEDQTKGEALRFEIMRLDDIDGTAVDSTVVDAASVKRIVQQAASVGQRIYIRPADSGAR